MNTFYTHEIAALFRRKKPLKFTAEMREDEHGLIILVFAEEILDLSDSQVHLVAEWINAVMTDIRALGVPVRHDMFHGWPGQV